MPSVSPSASAKTTGELPEPVHAREGGDQSNGGAHGAGGLPVDDLEEMLVAHLVFVRMYWPARASPVWSCAAPR